MPFDYRRPAAPLSVICIAGLFALLAAHPAPAIADATPQTSNATTESPVALAPHALVEGRVRFLLADPRGAIDGLLFDDGMLVTLRPALSQPIADSLRSGDRIAVRGVMDFASQISATSIQPGDAARVIPIDWPARPTRADPLAGETAGPSKLIMRGRILAVRRARSGDIEGAILDDGTQVRLTNAAARAAAPLLHVGRSIAVFGFGTQTPHGIGLEALVFSARD